MLLAGVCGGFAEYFGVDPTIVRLIYVVLCFMSFGTGLLLYIVLAIIMPNEPAESEPQTLEVVEEEAPDAD